MIQNLDRLTEDLRAHNSACIGGNACPLVVRGVLDAVVGPDQSRFDFTNSPLAIYGVKDYATWTAVLDQVAAARGVTGDESCRTFFVRMALLDPLVSRSYVEEMVTDPVLGELTVEKFAVILQRELSAFPKLPETAEEGDAMTVAPGVFAPACPKHDAIWDDAQVYGVTITPDGEDALRLFDVFEAWRQGTSTAVLTQYTDRHDTVCP